MTHLASIRSWLAERTRPLSLGERGEGVAVKYLRRRRYKIVATRRRLRFGEIDVIAVDGRTVVFVEVKTRRRDDEGRPAEAVDLERRTRMTRAALAFLKAHNLLEHAARFDVIEVVWPKSARSPQITHLKKAFEAEGRGQMFR